LVGAAQPGRQATEISAKKIGAVHTEQTENVARRRRYSLVEISANAIKLLEKAYPNYREVANYSNLGVLIVRADKV
jgi:tRNA (Thr-GGU) A37 N-methylase